MHMATPIAATTGLFSMVLAILIIILSGTRAAPNLSRVPPDTWRVPDTVGKILSWTLADPSTDASSFVITKAAQLASSVHKCAGFGEWCLRNQKRDDAQPIGNVVLAFRCNKRAGKADVCNDMLYKITYASEANGLPTTTADSCSA